MGDNDLLKTMDEALRDIYDNLAGPLRNKLGILLNSIGYCVRSSSYASLPEDIREMLEIADSSVKELIESDRTVGEIFRRLPEGKLLEYNQHHLRPKDES